MQKSYSTPNVIKLGLNREATLSKSSLFVRAEAH